MVLDINDTLSYGPNVSKFSCINSFGLKHRNQNGPLCEIGRMPAQREQLQCTVRKGRRASTKPARGMMG